MVNIGNSWDEILKDEWGKEYYLRLRKNLIQEYRNHTIFPPMEQIFDALKFVPYEKVRVVILGQDPYHGKGQAHGFSFSVLPGTRIPPSLVNIYKELQADLGCKIPNHGYLLDWAKQGVLLLNTSLTVREGQANSHENIGWHILTDRIIRILGEREEPLVFILWGRNAINKIPLIKNNNHLMIKSAHPSPLAAYRGFWGSKPFSKANEFLLSKGYEPIDWQIKDL